MGSRETSEEGSGSGGRTEKGEREELFGNVKRLERAGSVGCDNIDRDVVGGEGVGVGGEKAVHGVYMAEMDII